MPIDFLNLLFLINVLAFLITNILYTLLTVKKKFRQKNIISNLNVIFVRGFTHLQYSTSACVCTHVCFSNITHIICWTRGVNSSIGWHREYYSWTTQGDRRDQGWTRWFPRALKKIVLDPYHRNLIHFWISPIHTL